MKSDDTISDKRLQWLGSGRKIGSQMLKQAVNFTQMAFIKSFKPLSKQTLTHGSRPALFMKKSNVMARIGTPNLSI